MNLKDTKVIRRTKNLNNKLKASETIENFKNVVNKTFVKNDAEIVEPKMINVEEFFQK